jgi:hypothetical protein
MRLSPGSWRAQGIPYQLTFDPLNETPYSISATGTMALEVGGEFNNIYFIPLCSRNTTVSESRPTCHRNTQCARDKVMLACGRRKSSIHCKLLLPALQALSKVRGLLILLSIARTEDAVTTRRQLVSAAFVCYNDWRRLYAHILRSMARRQLLDRWR